MPYIMQGRRKNAAILFAYTEWNPFRVGGNESLEALIEGKNRTYVMIRGYGFADKGVGNAFPKFNRKVNVVTRGDTAEVEQKATKVTKGKDFIEAVQSGTARVARGLCPGQLPAPAIVRREWNGNGCVPPRPWEGIYPRLPKWGTNRCVADPGGNKNWFMKWYRAAEFPGGTWHFVYREWPPRSTHGWWAEISKATMDNRSKQKFDGYPGEAQRYEFAPGILRYKRVILEAEGWVWTGKEWDGSNAEKIFERFIDPRMGGVEVATDHEDGTSIIQLMEDEQRDAEGNLIGPSMTWYPAPGGSGAIASSQALEIFNEQLEYDTKHPVSVMNCPKWYVVDACEQSILAYEEYTGLDGEKGAMKDIVDPDWYYVKSEPEHVDEERAFQVRGAEDEDAEEL